MLFPNMGMISPILGMINGPKLRDERQSPVQEQRRLVREFYRHEPLHRETRIHDIASGLVDLLPNWLYR